MVNVGAWFRVSGPTAALLAMPFVSPVTSLAHSVSGRSVNPVVVLPPAMNHYQGDWYAVAGFLMTLIVVIVLPQKER